MKISDPVPAPNAIPEVSSVPAAAAVCPAAEPMLRMPVLPATAAIIICDAATEPPPATVSVPEPALPT